jgi:hypothetical protein
MMTYSQSNRIEHHLQNGQILSFSQPLGFEGDYGACLKLIKIELGHYWHFRDRTLHPATKAARGTLAKAVRAIMDDVIVCSWSIEDELERHLATTHLLEVPNISAARQGSASA